MMTKLSNILSVVFHPVFMVLIGLLVIFNSGLYIYDVHAEYKRYIFTIVLLCNVLAPFTLVPALYVAKNLQVITLDERRARLILLFFSTLCFYMGYYLVSRFSPVQIINLYLFSGVVVVLATLIVSVFWKISLHMAGLGGLTGLVIMLSFVYALDMTFYLAIVLFVSGMVASARLALQAHSLVQIAAGYSAGLLIVCLFLARLLF